MFDIERMLAQPTEIKNYLFLSSVDSLKDEDFFRNHNVTHILSVMKNSLPSPAKDLQIKHGIIPIDDSPAVNIQDMFQYAIGFINEAKNNQSSVLVHCEKGISRSASIVIAYLLHEQHTQGFFVSYNDTLKELLKKRACVWPNSGFTIQLQAFAHSLNKKLLSKNFPELTDEDYLFFADHQLQLDYINKIATELKRDGVHKLDLPMLIGFSGQSKLAQKLLDNCSADQAMTKNLIIGAIHGSQVSLIKEIKLPIESVLSELITHAVAKDNIEILEYFDMKYKNFSWKFLTPQGGNLLFVAAFYGAFRSFEFLYHRKRLDTNQCDTSNSNLLHSLVFSENQGFIEFVRAVTPTLSPLIKNNLGFTPLQIAERRHNQFFLKVYQNWKLKGDESRARRTLHFG